MRVWVLVILFTVAAYAACARFLTQEPRPKREYREDAPLIIDGVLMPFPGRCHVVFLEAGPHTVGHLRHNFPSSGEYEFCKEEKE